MQKEKYGLPYKGYANLTGFSVARVRWVRLGACPPHVCSPRICSPEKAPLICSAVVLSTPPLWLIANICIKTLRNWLIWGTISACGPRMQPRTLYAIPVKVSVFKAFLRAMKTSGIALRHSGLMWAYGFDSIFWLMAVVWVRLVPALCRQQKAPLKGKSKSMITAPGHRDVATECHRSVALVFW